MLLFRYRHQARHCWPAPRARPSAARCRAALPQTAGLWLAWPRRSRSAWLNQIADEFAEIAPEGTPPLWVTSVARSVDAPAASEVPRLHRAAAERALHRLRRRHRDGVVPPVPARTGVLRGLLLDRQRAGEINVIDEGQAWHVCLRPDAGPGAAPGPATTSWRLTVMCGIALIAGPGASSALFGQMLDAPEATRRRRGGQPGRRAACRNAAAAHRRPGARGPALDLRRRALAAVLQRRDLQPPRAARRTASARPPVPQRERHRGRHSRRSRSGARTPCGGCAGSSRSPSPSGPPAGPTWPVIRSGSSRCTGRAATAACTSRRRSRRSCRSRRRCRRCRRAATAGPALGCPALAPYVDLLSPHGRRRAADRRCRRSGQGAAPGGPRGQHRGPARHRPDRSA